VARRPRIGKTGPPGSLEVLENPTERENVTEANNVAATVMMKTEFKVPNSLSNFFF
jgi:hypothetical protein